MVDDEETARWGLFRRWSHLASRAGAAEPFWAEGEGDRRRTAGTNRLGEGISNEGAEPVPKRAMARGTVNVNEAGASSGLGGGSPGDGVSEVRKEKMPCGMGCQS